MWKSTSDLGGRRVDGVGRPKFDFHTGRRLIVALARFVARRGGRAESSAVPLVFRDERVGLVVLLI